MTMMTLSRIIKMTKMTMMTLSKIIQKTKMTMMTLSKMTRIASLKVGTAAWGMDRWGPGEVSSSAPSFPHYQRQEKDKYTH